MTLSASRELVECPHAPECGGCPWLRASQADQLARKHARLAAALARYPELSRVEVAEVIPAPRLTDFRARAKLVAAPGPRLGLYTRSGHEVVDIPRCRVLHPALREVADTLRRLGAQADAPAALMPRSEGGGALLAVDLRRAGRGERDEVLVTLVVDQGRVTDERELGRAARALRAADARVVTVAVATRAVDSARVLGGSARVVDGLDQVPDDSSGVTHLAVPGGFVQSNAAQARWLGETLRAELERTLGGLRGRRVVDAFAGAGALGLHLAARGARVTAIESHPASAAAARRAPTARLEVVEATSDVALGRLAASPDGVDAVVVDPPRRGLDPSTRDALGRLRPAVVAYVSCNPATFARDLAHLARLGLGAERVTPVDMMPHTDEIEALAILRPRAPAAPRSREWAGELVRELPPHEPPVPRARRGPMSLPEATSGLAPARRSLRGAEAPVDAAWVLAVRGRAPRGGTLHAGPATLRFRRLTSLSGVSVIGVVARPEPGATALLGRFAAAGWPVVGAGARGAAATDRHLLERHGLDRAFAHRVGLRRAGRGSAPWLVADLAPDLLAVLESLEGPTREATATAKRGATATDRVDRWLEALRRDADVAL